MNIVVQVEELVKSKTVKHLKTNNKITAYFDIIKQKNFK